MNKSKEEILYGLTKNRHHSEHLDDDTIYAAMDSYAQQVSIAFAKYSATEAVRVGLDSWQHRQDGFRARISSQDLFNLFITEYNKEGK